MADPPRPGAVFAELTGGYDTTNLNLHPSVAPYELVCPGDVSFRPGAEQIPVDDLVIVDEPAATGCSLRSKPPRRPGHPGLPGLPHADGAAGGAADAAELLLHRHGRDWTCGAAPTSPWATAEIGGHPAGALPRHGAGASTVEDRAVPAAAARRRRSDAEWMLDWMRWAREHGLPRRVFVTVDAGGPREEAAAEPGAPQPAPARPDGHTSRSTSTSTAILPAPAGQHGQVGRATGS